MVSSISSILLLSLSLAVSTTAASYDCRPGQKCWPSLSQWQQLNASVDGDLHETIPIAASCYKDSEYYDPQACKVVEDYYGDSIIRGKQFEQTYWLNWETCQTSGCVLLESDPTQTTYANCSIGRLASYYVDAREPSHISSTLKFATAHNIRISVKNTSHDFYGRFSVPNTLAIWTKNLDNLTAHDCPASNSHNIGELGAGFVAQDPYYFFSNHSMDIMGGYEESVGLAGGFAEGGGVGSFTTTYGLMADNAVEFEVVTADGELRVINQCNDADFFFRRCSSTHLFTANFTNAGPHTNATENVALREILTEHAQRQIGWSAQLITGQIEYFPEKFAVSLALVYGDNGSKLKAATADFDRYLRNRTDLSVSEHGYNSYTNYAQYLTVTAAETKITEPSGIFSLLSPRLIPTKVFTDPKPIDELVEGVLQGIATARSLLDLSGTQIVSETPLTNSNADESSAVNPAWRDALWHVIHVGEWLEPMDDSVLRSTAEGILHTVDPLKALSPGGGAYLNEASYLEPDWEQTYFGSFYDRLLEVKNRYDPTHIFGCWKCVGWRGEADPFYSCYA
ncbi:FAD binding domain-containing protein [Penicillium malachiteum]|uniref:FAD binding domain-containing protein n=1 Tax=Penicillium malachiteum TaxID=1324776 RepID=A0AAD6N034_9EURO|nr:FAD binding domain-containing protein [Penicillium malachiteum]